MLLQDLDALESESYEALTRNLDLRAYSVLSGQVARFTTEKIAEDWEACKQAISTGTAEDIANG